jgi:hypothetical protein
MTRMSDPTPTMASGFSRIPARTLGASPLARAVHGVRSPVYLRSLLVLAVASSGGCVIPPDLSVVDGDAGTNSPPAILAVRSDLEELPEPGPVVFDRGLGSLNITLLDTDVTDTLYVRVFVDYTNADPTAPRSTCTARCTEPCSAQRSVTCDLGALCLQSDIGVERFMTVNVFDRELKESGSPQFKAMEPPGLTTSKSYKLKCQEPTQ